MMIGRQRNCLVFVCLLFGLTSMTAHAQSLTPEDEYKKLIQVHATLEPLGAHPFGEQVDLYSGTLSFEATDISLPGNGPLLQLSRSLSTTDAVGFTFNFEFPFGDWDLDIPRIETVTGDQANVTGWDVEAANPLDRCTNFGPPPPARAHKEAIRWIRSCGGTDIT